MLGSHFNVKETDALMFLFNNQTVLPTHDLLDVYVMTLPVIITL